MSINDRKRMKEAIEVSTPGYARNHSGKEPSEPPEPTDAATETPDSIAPTSRPSRASLLDRVEKADIAAEKATKIAASLKTWGSLLAAFAMGLSTAFGWAAKKANKSDVAAVAASDRAAHEQFAKEQEAQNMVTAELKGGQAVIMAQNNEILAMVRKLNAFDEKRGNPTRIPITTEGPR